MKNFEFDVEGAEVIYTDRKPMPYNPLYRRKPSYTGMLAALFVYLIVAAAIAAVCRILSDTHTIAFAVIWSVLYFFAIGKRAAIWLIRLYQYKAPDNIRLRCVFYPSCSEYMILAIQKYGTIRGICKGIARLLRCHVPNGGEDYP